MQKGRHLNEKINVDGSRSAIQFHDDSDGLDWGWNTVGENRD